MDVTVKPVGTDTEIYLSQIDEVAADFLDTHPVDTETGKMSGEMFVALLGFIYSRVFRPPTQNYSRYQNVRMTSIVDYEDIAGLDRIFDRYVDLCARCSQTPTMTGFCTMVGIDRSTLADWRDGKRRSNSYAHSLTVKRWYALCESALSQRAISSNSIGAIFTLKSCYAWRETAPLPVEELQTANEESPAEIAQRYQNASLPEKPDF